MRMYSLAVNPMEPVFRKMLAVSVVLHAGVIFLGALWAVFRGPAHIFVPVAVVDLVGGEAFHPAPPRSARPEKAESPAAPAPVKKSSKEKAPPERTAKAEKDSKSGKRASTKGSEPADASALADKIRKMREKRETAEHVREAVTTIRREKAARTAISQIGERLAHRVDLSTVAPPPRRTGSPAQGGGIAGAVGTKRLPPEHLAYFRQLDERIRSNWTVPEHTLREAENLMVQLRILIERNGVVSHVRMEKTSGNRYFDESVLRAINKASPLPVPPEELRGGEDHYEVGFRFYGAGGAS